MNSRYWKIYTNNRITNINRRIEDMMILERFGMLDVIEFDEISLNENQKIDYAKIRQQIKEYSSKIAFLVKKIVVKKSKDYYFQMRVLISNFNEERKQISAKDAKKLLKCIRDLFIALSFLTIGLYGNGCLDSFLQDSNFEVVDGQVVYNDNGEYKNSSDFGVKLTDEQKNQKIAELFSPIIMTDSTEHIEEYHASEELKQKIMKMEGCFLYVYDAHEISKKRIKIPLTKYVKTHPYADLTIGYGHKLTRAEIKSWKNTKKITKEEALRMFNQDFPFYEKNVNEHLRDLPYFSKVNFSQGFIDGLISIRYNSSEKLLFGHPDWLKEWGEKISFWESMKMSRLDKENGCLRMDDFNVATKKIKTLFKLRQDNKKGNNGLLKRRLAEYRIMRQPYGSINPKLYK